MAKDPYEILQVARHAEPEVIEGAYRRLARKYHPDVNRSPTAKARMQDVNWAYDILGNREKRAQYDSSSRRKQTQQTGYRSTSGPGRATSSSGSSSTSGPSGSEGSRPSASGYPGGHSRGQNTRTQPTASRSIKLPRLRWWIAGAVGLLIAISYCNPPTTTSNSVGSGSSTQAPTRSVTAAQPSPLPAVSSAAEPNLGSEDAILLMLRLLIEDERYDPATSVLHRYINDITVELNSSRLSYTVWDLSINEDDMLSLAFDLILLSTIVVDGSDVVSSPLELIEVISPGPLNSSATFYVSGRQDIAAVGGGSVSVFDVMETSIDWGDAAPPEVVQPTTSGCPFGCSSQPIGCNIKGNISINSGEKIYHVPGQEFYNETIIRPEYGERWFCTEDEAAANGWRRAQR